MLKINNNRILVSLNEWRVMLDMHMGPFPWHPDHAYETKLSWSV
jgi:hypothetical protein